MISTAEPSLSLVRYSVLSVLDAAVADEIAFDVLNSHNNPPGP
jgi:hypothetical protein